MRLAGAVPCGPSRCATSRPRARCVRSRWSRTVPTSSPAATRWSRRRSLRRTGRARGPQRHRRDKRVRGARQRPLRGRGQRAARRGQHADRARRPGGKRITITNHPIGGPVFAGPQVTPYACNPNVSTPPLGPALDAQCNAPTRVELLYRNAAGQFVAYDPAIRRGRAIQTTTTDSGRTVPFIVERVTGTVDRGIFQFASLVDPAKPVTPWSTEQPWSRKLLYVFGGACGTEHRSSHRRTCSSRSPRSAPASSSPRRASTSTPTTAMTSSRPRRR